MLHELKSNHALDEIAASMFVCPINISTLGDRKDTAQCIELLKFIGCGMADRISVLCSIEMLKLKDRHDIALLRLDIDGSVSAFSETQAEDVINSVSKNQECLVDSYDFLQCLQSMSQQQVMQLRDRFMPSVLSERKANEEKIVSRMSDICKRTQGLSLTEGEMKMLDAAITMVERRFRIQHVQQAGLSL